MMGLGLSTSGHQKTIIKNDGQIFDNLFFEYNYINDTRLLIERDNEGIFIPTGSSVNDFTLIARLIIDDVPENRGEGLRIFASDDVRGINNQMRTYGSNNYSVISYSNGALAIFLDEDDWVDGVEHEFAFKARNLPSDVEWKVFRDGVIVGQGNVANYQIDHSNARITMFRWNNNLPGSACSGQLRNLVLHNEALDDQDIIDYFA